MNFAKHSIALPVLNGTAIPLYWAVAKGGAPPGFLAPNVTRSDHWAFRREGCPACMLTDTAEFRSDRMHTRADTPDYLDYDRMARVVTGVVEVAADLAAGLPGPAGSHVHPNRILRAGRPTRRRSISPSPSIAMAAMPSSRWLTIRAGRFR